jgi:glutathionylspermidine synthase
MRNHPTVRRNGRKLWTNPQYKKTGTQRKILETMWTMWLRHQPFAPARFTQKPTAPGEQAAAKTIGG